MNKKEKIVGIYKITSPSGKIYIGQSANIEQRFSYYKKLRCKRQTHIYNSLSLYGVKTHKFEIIHRCEVNDLNILEAKYISEYNSTNREIGLNLQTGGECFRDSEETKLLKKMSNPNRKEFYAERNGVVIKFNSMTEAEKILGVTRKSIRESLKDPNKKIGKYSYSYEYPTEITNNKRIWKPRPDDVKIKISQNHKCNKKIIAILGDEKFYFNSISLASKELGDSKKVIGFALKNPNKSKSKYKYILQ